MFGTTKEFESLVEMYSSLIRVHAVPRVKGLLMGMGIPEAIVDRAAEVHRRSCQLFLDLKDPRVLRGHQDIESWYGGPDFEGAWCWPAYKDVLPGKGFDEDAIDSIDSASTRIMAHLPHPQNLRIRTRGLVVGYVQSGKTANYTALISKAADAGYKLFIVMAGMTSSLRRQTQQRLMQELCNLSTENWFPLTNSLRDFNEGAQNPAAVLTPRNPNLRILAVVKKNTHILARLNRFLRRAGEGVLENCPTLLIDDEADQASINTRRQAEERSTINRRILELLEALPKSAYVAYTATPFANVFIDPAVEEDLYPRDFICSLPRPPAYFGAERVFGREGLRTDDQEDPVDGLDIIRDVLEPDEVNALKPPGRDARFGFEPQVTPSLEDAVIYFILATACRYVRGQQKHSSMLVHTTLYTLTHQQLHGVISGHITLMHADLVRGSGDWFEKARQVWESESGRVVLDHLKKQPEQVPVQGLVPRLASVLDRLEVVVDNGALGSGLDYPDITDSVPPRVVIAVGGNTLSRGLTLEGLIVSYFIRHASAYDTLLQMGRWFGYRPGYEDLPRAWMPQSLQLDFHHLATVEEELRNDIARYEAEKLTPTEFAVRVRTHPRLVPTSRMKMQNVVLTNVSFSNSRQQTTFFEVSDGDWIGGNTQAARDLVGAARMAKCAYEPGRRLFRDVPVDAVRQFIRDYSIHEKHLEFRRDYLMRYLDSENRQGALGLWNVCVVSRKPGASTTIRSPGNGLEVDLGAMELGLDARVPCLNRSRWLQTSPPNIKALTSAPDRVRDLDFIGSQQRPTAEAGMVDVRNQRLPDHGLLLLYPISKDSIPIVHSDHKSPGRRHPLKAADHLVGLAMVFPKARVSEDNYVSNNLAPLRDHFDGHGDYTAEDEELVPTLRGDQIDEAELEG